MDTYLLALVIPDMALYVATPILANFISLFAAERAAHGEREAWNTAGKMLTAWLTLLWSVVTVGLVLAPVLVLFVAPGFTEGQRVVTAGYTRLLLFMALAAGSARILAAALFARKQFLVASLGEVCFQLSSTSFLVAFHSWGIEALVWGMVLGAFVQLGVLGAGLACQRVAIPLTFAPKHPVVRRMVGLTLPVYVGSAGAQVDSLVTRAFSSTLPVGGVTALQYAYLIVDSVAVVVGDSFGKVLLPFLSQQHAEKDRSRFARSLDRGVVAISMVMMPAAVGLLLLARPLVQVVLERGSFDAYSSDLTVAAIRVYALAMIPIGLDYLLRSVYFAQQNTATASKIGLVRAAFSVMACSLLVPRMGLVGVALSVTAGYYLKLVLMMFFLRGVEERAALAAAGRSVLKVGQAVTAMSVAVYAIMVFAMPAHLSLNLAGVLRLGFPVAAGVVVFLLTFYFVSSSDFAYFTGLLLRRSSGGPAPGSRGEAA